MTNEWLQGYIAALNNITAYCETTKQMKTFDEQICFNEVNLFIKQVKENYKELVKDLNEKSKG